MEATSHRRSELFHDLMKQKIIHKSVIINSVRVESHKSVAFRVLTFWLATYLQVGFVSSILLARSALTGKYGLCSPQSYPQ